MTWSRSSPTRMQPADVVERVVDFGRVLRSGDLLSDMARREGLEVGPTRVADAVSALALVGIADRERVYWTLRQTLASSVDELEEFRRQFTPKRGSCQMKPG